jgi:hypothetical protein
MVFIDTVKNVAQFGWICMQHQFDMLKLLLDVNFSVSVHGSEYLIIFR